MPTPGEIIKNLVAHLRNIAGDSVEILKKSNDKVVDKLEEGIKLKGEGHKFIVKSAREVGDAMMLHLGDIEKAVKNQKEVESISINNPEAITGDLKAGLEGVIQTLKDELKNFDKNIVVKNDFSNFASLFKTSQDKTAIIDALKKIEDKLEKEDKEDTDYTMILSDIATAVENKESLIPLLTQLVEQEIKFPSVMAVDLDPNLVENDRLKVVLRKDQVAQLSATASANNLPLIDAIKTGDTWLQQLGLDKDDVSNYYFGFKQIDTDLWRVKRINKTTFAVDWASGDSNPDTAWTNRTSLTYGNL